MVVEPSEVFIISLFKKYRSDGGYFFNNTPLASKANSIEGSVIFAISSGDFPASSA